MKKIVFMSYPDFSDNSFAIFYTMIKKKMARKYIWFYYKRNKNYIDKKIKQYFEPDEMKNVTFIEATNPIPVAWHYLTANTIISTHGCVDFLPLLKWQTKINLWHGMPLKRIAALDFNATKSPQKMDLTIATSPLFKEIVAQCFELELSKVIEIGSPRMDFLLMCTDQLRIDFGIKEKDNIYLWMPTYRKSGEGKAHEDGIINQTIGNLTPENFAQLNKVLVDKNEYMFIKLHPMDYLNASEEIKLFDFSNIKIFTSDSFLNHGYEINHLLAMSDVLITDYSSVYFDYAILNRPIILYTDDDSTYRENRGFTSETIYQVMNHSLRVVSANDFIEAIKKSIEKLPILSPEQNRIINQYAENQQQGKTYSEIFIMNNDL
ncbi:MAG: CDP-glycerol glycerophosphotransferase family protein [Culicoidibacterales bacterium]